MSSSRPDIETVVSKTISKVFVFEGIPRLFNILNWTADWQKCIAGVLGVVFKIATAIVINGSIISTKYPGVNSKTRLISAIVINIGYFLTTMGTVWSEQVAANERAQAAIDREKKHNELMKNHEQTKRNHAESMRKHDEVMQLLKDIKDNGSNTDQSINDRIDKAIETASAAPRGYHAQPNWLYEPIDLLTGDELKQ